MQSASFTLVHTSSVLQRKWKSILLFVVICAALAAAAVFIAPRYFRSSATVVPGNALLADRSRLFNSNIKDLYSYFGNGDDLDRIIALAERELTFNELVDSFALVQYYHLDNDSAGILRRKAVLRLKKDISLRKTEQGQLQITAWTKNKDLSAALVNRMIAIAQDAATEIWRNNYIWQIEKIDHNIAQFKEEYARAADSAKTSALPFNQMRIEQLKDRIQQYNRISDEFKLALQSVPSVLYVTEPAVPAAFAERPDKPAVVIAACLLAFVFACIVVLVNDRKANV